MGSRWSPPGPRSFVDDAGLQRFPTWSRAGLEFEDQGQHDLKGLDQPVQLWSVT